MLKIFQRKTRQPAVEAPVVRAPEVLDVIERLSAASDGSDAMAVALGILRDPALPLHGPEHDFLVPAALLAAWSNARGEPEKRAERVREARRRAEAIAGAAAGAGTFVAIAAGDGTGSALAERMTARAGTILAAADSGRCSRRDALLSILAAVRFANEHLDAKLVSRGLACEWCDVNERCAGAACPFNR